MTKSIATDRDEIIAWLKGNGEKLSTKQQEVYDRIDFADNIIRRYYKPSSEHGRIKTDKELANFIATKFNVSIATAYRDIQDCRLIFGSIRRVDKEYHRIVMVEMFMDAIRIARESIPVNVREYINALNGLSKILGLDKEDSETPNWSELEPHEVNIYLDKRSQTVVNNIIMQGAVNLNDYLTENA